MQPLLDPLRSGIPVPSTVKKPVPTLAPMSALRGSVRRGSLWGGSASLSAPSTSQMTKDPRPLRDRSYQSKMRQDVVNYLNSSGFEISMSTLANIQGKDYRAIFHALALTLDSCYPFKEVARFEDEFVPALKALRYPFAHQIDQKWLAAVASPHSWPYLLGTLHWLVELCKVCQDSFQNCIHFQSLVDARRIPLQRASYSSGPSPCSRRI
jgi:kinetochore protein NDC80